MIKNMSNYYFFCVILNKAKKAMNNQNTLTTVEG